VVCGRWAAFAWQPRRDAPELLELGPEAIADAGRVRAQLLVGDETELQSRAGEVVEQPSAGNLVHPLAHGAAELTEPQVPELTELEGLERGVARQTAPGSAQRFQVQARKYATAGTATP